MTPQTTYAFKPIAEKINNLKLQLNYVSYDAEMSNKLKTVWEAYFELEKQIEILLPVEGKQVGGKENLDEFKNGFSESDMREFALDYFDRFMKDYAKDGVIDPIESVKFLSENIKKFLPVEEKQVSKEEVQDIVNDLKAQIQGLQRDHIQMDSAHWMKQEGVLLSGNEAKLIVSQLIGGGKEEKDTSNCQSCGKRTCYCYTRM